MLYKSYFPSANYDDEPSVSKGIVSQLPSSHLFIHRVPAKLLDRVMPYGKYRCRLQLLFLLIVTDHAFSVAVLIHSVDAFPPQTPSGLFPDNVFLIDIVYGFLFQNPANFPTLAEPWQSSGYLFFTFYATDDNVFLPGRLISFSNFSGSYFTPVFRIV